MNPKPDPRIAEPPASVGYAETIEQPAPAKSASLTAKQQSFLREALDDLAELDEYAEELDMPPPSPVAKEAAQVFVEQAVREVPRSYTVSPWDEGEVIVSTKNEEGFGVSIFFNANGGASCFIIHPSPPRRERDTMRHYSQANKVANKWVFDALQKLNT